MNSDHIAEGQTELLSCLQTLIRLAQQKKKVLLERAHDRLPAIVAEENEVLQRLNELHEKRLQQINTTEHDNTVNSDHSQQLVQIASAVAQLQRLNGLNADLVKEHLQSVEVCLTLLEQALSNEYGDSGTPVGKGKTMRGIINMQA